MFIVFLLRKLHTEALFLKSSFRYPSSMTKIAKAQSLFSANSSQSFFSSQTHPDLSSQKGHKALSHCNLSSQQ
jgi:hypothetical protein